MSELSAAAARGDAQPPLLEVAHVAHRLRVSVDTVRRLIRGRRLVAVRLDGGHYRVDPRDLERYLQDRRTGQDMTNTSNA